MRYRRKLRLLIIIISFSLFYAFGVAYNEGEYYKSIAFILGAIILLLINRRFYR